MSIPGAAGRPLVVEKGDSLTFRLAAGDVAKEMWHSLTSCKAPCNRSTGIAYPLPDGEPVFDSGQLGPRADNTGAVGRNFWSTPTDLKPGTYPFYCRIHPLMRGAIRVVPNS
jgi:plastocyanin